MIHFLQLFTLEINVKNERRFDRSTVTNSSSEVKNVHVRFYTKEYVPGGHVGGEKQ